MERPFYFGAKPDLFSKASQLRQKMTLAEKTLWNYLKENQLGVRFKPQHPIDIFIADFYCHAMRLVIEVDGGIHARQQEYDIGRTSELGKYQIRVIRFTYDEVLNEIKKVLTAIKAELEDIH